MLFFCCNAQRYQEEKILRLMVGFICQSIFCIFRSTNGLLEANQDTIRKHSPPECHTDVVHYSYVLRDSYTFTDTFTTEKFQGIINFIVVVIQFKYTVNKNGTFLTLTLYSRTFTGSQKASSTSSRTNAAFIVFKDLHRQHKNTIYFQFIMNGLVLFNKVRKK